MWVPNTGDGYSWPSDIKPYKGDSGEGFQQIVNAHNNLNNEAGMNLPQCNLGNRVAGLYQLKNNYQAIETRWACYPRYDFQARYSGRMDIRQPYELRHCLSNIELRSPIWFSGNSYGPSIDHLVTQYELGNYNIISFNSSSGKMFTSQPKIYDFPSLSYNNTILQSTPMHLGNDHYISMDNGDPNIVYYIYPDGSYYEYEFPMAYGVHTFPQYFVVYDGRIFCFIIYGSYYRSEPNVGFGCAESYDGLNWNFQLLWDTTGRYSALRSIGNSYLDAYGEIHISFNDWDWRRREYRSYDAGKNWELAYDYEEAKEFEPPGWWARSFSIRGYSIGLSSTSSYGDRYPRAVVTYDDWATFSYTMPSDFIATDMTFDRPNHRFYLTGNYPDIYGHLGSVNLYHSSDGFSWDLLISNWGFRPAPWRAGTLWW